MICKRTEDFNSVFPSWIIYQFQLLQNDVPVYTNLMADGILQCAVYGVFYVHKQDNKQQQD